MQYNLLRGLLACMLCIILAIGCIEQKQVDEERVLADVRSMLGSEMYEEAESTLVALQATMSLSSDGLALLGSAQVGLFNDEDAISNFRAALRMQAEDLDVRLQLVQALRRSGLLEEALDEIDAVQWESIPHFRYELGQIQMQRGAFEEAISHFEQAVRLDPRFVEGYYGLGTALQRIGEIEKGGEVLDYYQSLHAATEDVKLDEQIVELNPESADAHYNLGRAYEQLGDSQRAIQSYLTAIELDSTMQEAYNNLGIVYFGIDENEKAVQAFRQAISISDTTAKYYFNLGTVTAKQGDFIQAERLWMRALELDPDYQKARDFLEQLEQSRK